MTAGHTAGFVPALAALLGNATIGILKWIGFFATGSSVLFAEAVHSLADVSNQALLLFGVIRARRAPTPEFEYGYGRERFFWALISACGIFFLGAGITLFHAWEAIMHPVHAGLSSLSLGILVVALAIELATLVVALRALKMKFRTHSWRYALAHGDPVTVAVVYEDAVAVLGVLVALGSMALAEYTGEARWDGFGALLIGGLLAFIAIVLIRKNHQYLIGRSMPEAMRRKIVKLLENDPIIEKVIDFKSSTLGLDEYRVKCEIEVNGTSLFREMRERQFVSDSFEEMGDSEEEFVRFCVEYADRIPRIIGEHINRVEGLVQKAYPSVVHIDIELN